MSTSAPRTASVSNHWACKFKALAWVRVASRRGLDYPLHFSQTSLIPEFSVPRLFLSFHLNKGPCPIRTLETGILTHTLQCLPGQLTQYSSQPLILLAPCCPFSAL